MKKLFFGVALIGSMLSFANGNASNNDVVKTENQILQDDGPCAVSILKDGDDNIISVTITCSGEE